MPLVVRTHPGDRLVQGRGTLLARCLAEGLPVASACSGRGACARCLVTVLSGGEHLSPPRERERQVLARTQANADQRLSCQCRVQHAGEQVLITTGYW